MSQIGNKINILVVLMFVLCSTALSEDIFQAAQNGNLARVQEFITAGANVNQQSPIGWKPLRRDQEVRYNWNPLHFAAHEGHLAVVQALIAAGANVNDQSGPQWRRDGYTDGRTPLILAAERGHLEVVQTLIAAGANVNWQDWYGWTALHDAVFNKHQAIAQILVAAGANVNLRNRHGQTPFQTDKSRYWRGDDLFLDND